MSELDSYLKLSTPELAERIDAHLKRFEADPAINAEQERESARPGVRSMWIKPYLAAAAFANQRYVYVQYLQFQGHTRLTRDEAVRYLAWLDAGNVGQHRSVLS